MIKKIATIILLLLLGHTLAQGQDYSPEDRYRQSRIELREMDRGRWADLTDNLDYSAKKGKVKRRKTDEPDPGANEGATTNSIFGEGTITAIARFLLITLVVILIALLVRSMLGYGRARNKNIRRAGEGINIQKIEENLYEADLVDYIQQAKDAGDFNLAIRLYYLSILKELSLKKAIKWKVDKTNSEYLREMRTHPQFTDFRALTLIFEQSWYGDRTLDAAAFHRLEPRFRGFITHLLPAAQALAL